MVTRNPLTGTVNRPIETDPLRNFKFTVDIHHNVPFYGGIAHLGFMSATGLAATTEVVSYREGGDNTTPRKMPGQTDFPPVSLSRGLVGKDYGMLLWQWYRQIFFVIQGGGLGLSQGAGQGSGDFRADAIYIRLYEHPRTRVSSFGAGAPKVAWKLFNAWPASLAFSDFDAGGNGVAVANMTLMYEGFDIRYGTLAGSAW